MLAERFACEDGARTQRFPRMKILLFPAVALTLTAGLSHAGAPDPAVMKAGQTNYALCMACHGPDGKGLQIGDKSMAPSLAGSKLALSDPEVFASIVLKGIQKEGDAYLQVMLPLEAALDDERLSAVMTYVRNSFGNKGEPVTKEQVAAARAKIKDRKTPFTRAELEAFRKKLEEK